MKINGKSTSETADQAFMKAYDDIGEHLAALQQMFDNHFEVDPENINWSVVEEMRFLRSQLKHITDRLLGEGEYSE